MKAIVLIAAAALSLTACNSCMESDAALYAQATKGGDIRDHIEIGSENFIRVRETWIGGCPSYYVVLKSTDGITKKYTVLVDHEVYSALKKMSRQARTQKWQGTLVDFEGIYLWSHQNEGRRILEKLGINNENE